MKRIGSSHHHLVQRLPADVVLRARGPMLTVQTISLTLSDKARDVRVSLPTRDPQDARKRQAVAVGFRVV